MQPGTDQWGQPQPAAPQPQYGQPPQPQIIGQPAMLSGQPTAGFNAPMQQVTNVMMSPSNGAATASLVLGIISFIFWGLGWFVIVTWCCSVPMSIIGVVLGHVGYSNSTTTGVGGTESIIGLILNWLQVGLLIILAIAIFIFGAALSSSI